MGVGLGVGLRFLTLLKVVHMDVEINAHGRKS